jgi:hypothetical protein
MALVNLLCRYVEQSARRRKGVASNGLGRVWAPTGIEPVLPSAA